MVATTATHAMTGPASRAARFTRHLTSAMARQNTRRKTQKILEGLSDRQLRDIGLSRIDVFLMR